jgi:GNAT superfamily N-acetyltransferase
VSIRVATEDDWAAIWPFWQQIVEAGETYAYPLGATSEQARGWWFDGSHVVVLVDDDGAVLGSAKMGPNRPGRGAHVGTASFMVDSAARGRGVGRRLGAYCVQWHRDEGFAAIQFNAVVETNTAAVRLWQDLGFTIIGTVPQAFDSATHGRVGLHVMHLDLAAG